MHPTPVHSLIDDGISGNGNRATEYWPSPDYTNNNNNNSNNNSNSVQTSWWEKSNWFRVKESTTAAAINRNEYTIDNSINSSESHGIPDVPVSQFLINNSATTAAAEADRESLINAPGYATSFNRFGNISSKKSSTNTTIPAVSITDSNTNNNNNTNNITPTAVSPAATITPTATATVTRKKRIIELKTVAGYGTEVARRLNELIVLPLCHPIVYKSIGIKPSHGIILSGLPGSGKTLLVKNIVDELGLYFQLIDGSNILVADQNQKQYNNTSAGIDSNNREHIIETIFRTAIKNAPAVIFIDEIDCIGSARNNNIAESIQLTKAKAVLRQELDRLSAYNPAVIVIGATNMPDSLCPSLLRTGRFDRHIVLNKPDTAGRLHILQQLTANMKLSTDINLTIIADRTIGFIGSDLQNLCVEAGSQCIREQLLMNDSDNCDNNISIPTVISQQSLSALSINQSHFLSAVNIIKPSSNREFQIDIPTVQWSDVGGNIDIKLNLIETVEYPLVHSELFKKFGLAPSSGVLLYGPPGCGKTLMARAIATQCKASFISINGPELLSSYLGQSEKAVRDLFSRARSSSPCVIFFDEIDSIAQHRSSGPDSGGNSTCDRVLNQLLIEIDNRTVRTATDPSKSSSNSSSASIQSSDPIVFIIAATNRPELIDPALLRPGRLDQLLFVGLPDESSRLEILKSITINSNTPLSIDIVNNNYHYLQQLAARTVRLSGADLHHLVNTARRIAVRTELDRTNNNNTTNSNVLTIEQFEQAFESSRASVSDNDLERYKYFNSIMKSNSTLISHQPKSINTADNNNLLTLNQMRARIRDEINESLSAGANPQQALNQILSMFQSTTANPNYSTTTATADNEEKESNPIATASATAPVRPRSKLHSITAKQ